MIEFFEPEDKYEIDEGNRRNVKTKIIFFSVVILIGIIFIFAIQKDFLNIFGREPIKESCVYGNTYVRADYEEVKLEKAQRALSDHLESFKDLKGYINAEVVMEDQIKNHQTPIIYIYLTKSFKREERVPKTLCGHQVVIKNK